MFKKDPRPLLHLNKAQTQVMLHLGALEGTHNPLERVVTRIEQMELALHLIAEAIQVLHQCRDFSDEVQTELPF